MSKMAAYEPDMEVVKKLVSELGKGSRAPKDEHAPKRPLTAFMQWTMEMRPKIVESNPDLKLGEIGKKLGEMWKQVDSADKNKFQAKYDEEKKKFDKKMDKYMKTAQWKDFQNHQLAWKIHGTKKPFPSDKNAPKRPMNGYMTFVNEQRETLRGEQPDLALTEVTKALTKRWNEMGAEGQKEYKDKAAKLKIQYKKKFDSYTKTDDYKKYVEEKEAYKMMMKAKRNKLMGIKKKKKVKKAAKSKSPSASRSRSRSRRKREKRKSSRKASKNKSKKSKNRKRKRSSSRSESRSESSARESKRMRKSKKSKNKSRKSSKKAKASKRKSGKSKKKSRKRSRSSDTEMDTAESS